MKRRIFWLKIEGGFREIDEKRLEYSLNKGRLKRRFLIIDGNTIFLVQKYHPRNQYEAVQCRKQDLKDILQLEEKK